MITRAFDIVREVRAKKMIQVGRVGSANAIRKAKEAIDLKGEIWGGGEHVSNPIMETVAVAEESNDISNHRVRLRTWSFVGRRRVLAKDKVY